MYNFHPTNKANKQKKHKGKSEGRQASKQKTSFTLPNNKIYF